MLKRILSAVVMILITLSTLYFGGVYTKIFVLFITGVGTYEMLNSYKSSGKNSLIIPSVILFAPSVISFFTDYEKPFEIVFSFAPEINFYPVLVFLALASIMIILVAKHDVFSVADGAFSLFCGIYVTALFNIITVLRGKPNGFYFVILAILGGIITDTFAMFSGMLFGKRKLCPNLSPNKTIAGSVGGFLGCIVSCNIYLLILRLIGIDIGFGYGLMTILAVVFGIVSQFGDLFASYIKRQFGIKDFGKLIPGHGGIMDRVDSFGILLPILYYVLKFASVI